MRWFWSDWVAVSPDYFDTAGVPLLEGRAFSDGDVDGSPWVGIVNESMARHYWR